MPYFDLNVPFVANPAELSRTLTFLAELGYTHVAVNEHVTDLKAAIGLPLRPLPAPFDRPVETRKRQKTKNGEVDMDGIDGPAGTLTVLRRCTVHLTAPTMSLLHARLPQLLAAFDVLSFRPTDEKSFLAACTTLPASLISLDLGSRLPFHFNSKHSALSAAVKRGCRFELCYAVATSPSSVPAPLSDPGVCQDLSATEMSLVRRLVIGNATGLIRALRRGRGLLISSGAGSALACRAPADVVNLACVWGLGTDRAWESLGPAVAGEYVEAERTRRAGWRGAVEIVDGGTVPDVSLDRPTGSTKQLKQKAGKQKKGPAGPAGPGPAGVKRPVSVSSTSTSVQHQHKKQRNSKDKPTQ